MRRADVYWVAFDPAVGGEIRKRRPAVLVSNDAAISAQNRVQVVPLTSNVTRVHSWEALVRVNGATSKAVADQIRTVAKQRVGQYLDTLTGPDMLLVEQAIRVQLGLP
jgi:mRNA interferase MazF